MTSNDSRRFTELRNCLQDISQNQAIKDLPATKRAFELLDHLWQSARSADTGGEKPEEKQQRSTALIPVLFETHMRDDTSDVVIRPTGQPDTDRLMMVKSGDWVLLITRVYTVRRTGGYERWVYDGDFAFGKDADGVLSSRVEISPSIAESYLVAWGKHFSQCLAYPSYKVPESFIIKPGE